MVVDARKFGYTMFLEPQTKSTEYLKSASHRNLKVAGHLPIRTKADFIIANTAKGSFIVIETKKRTEPVSISGEKWYATMPIVSREFSVEARLEKLEEQFNNLVRSTWSYLFTERDIKEMGELSKGILEDSKKMQELAQQLQETDDKS